jgi:hypothetical protein
VRVAFIVALAALGLSAAPAGANPSRSCSAYVNFGHVTAARGVSCASASLIADAYANLVVAGDQPPRRLDHYACTDRDPHPNSQDDHLSVTCTRGSKVSIRFTVGP